MLLFNILLMYNYPNFQIGPNGVIGRAIKELPMTFILRPFDFDTLSVRIYQYAGDERMVEAILPAILIMTLGLIASFTLIPSLEKKN